MFADKGSVRVKHFIRCYFRDVGRATVPAKSGRHGGRPYVRIWRLFLSSIRLDSHGGWLKSSSSSYSCSSSILRQLKSFEYEHEDEDEDEDEDETEDVLVRN